MNMLVIVLFVYSLYGCNYFAVCSTLPFVVCTAIGYIGVKYPNDFKSTTPPTSGNGINMSYLLMDADYMFPCCGVIEEWDAFVVKSGTIFFSIWRASSASNIMEPVGSNSVNVNGIQEIPLPIHPGARYTVYPGDYIGWSTTSDGMIAYKEGVGAEKMFVKYFTQPLIPPQMSLDWSTATSNAQYTYAVRARYGVNGAPRFVNLDADITVTPPIAIGQVIYTVIATDDDISDTTITKLIYNNVAKSNLFSFNSTSQNVTVIENLSSKVGYECLMFTVLDKCQNIATGQLCITIHNDPPSVTCIPQTTSVIESTAGNTNITSLNVSDINKDSVSCSLFGTSPSGNQFRLQQDSGVYMIYINANPDFRAASINQYSIHIACTDGKTFTSVICGVKIVPNERPTITNLPIDTVSLNTSNLKSYEVFKVNVSDPDSSSFTYSLTCLPNKCPFEISSSGVIQLTQNLENHTIDRYSVLITVKDGYNQVTNTFTVTISGINYAPVITSLPFPKQLVVAENSSIGTSVFQVQAYDVNKDSLTYSLLSSPLTGTNYYGLNSSSGLLSTVGELDFETMIFKSFILTVTVTDGKLSASSTLVVNVLDINEKPSFESSVYIIQANESSAGTRLPDPRFNVIDTDAGDNVKYSQDCGVNNGYIRMDANNGLLTFAVDYNLDGTEKPILISCKVNATDKGGLTATANLSIIINEINDHKPIFTYPSYTFYAHTDSAVGLLLGNVSATDADIGNNGLFNFTSDQSSLSKPYFDVSPTGQVTLQSNLNGVLSGTKLQFTLLATDYGSPPLYGSTIVTVIILQGSTTTASITTEKYKTFFRDEGNIVWFSLALITGLSIVAITALICARYICYWPSNFDPFNVCTMDLRKLEFCKDSKKYHNTKSEPKVSSREEIKKPRSPPRTFPPRAASVQMRPSPLPSRGSMITAPHTISTQLREHTASATSVQMWYSDTPPISTMIITPQASHPQMRAMITEYRRATGVQGFDVGK